jgi:C4-dicarboxylate-specific signal transduction histidine kinase
MHDVNTIQPKILIETRLLNTNEIEISLHDNGPGFDPALLNKLFEPNFTTKPYAIGLGLPTSRSIVEKHGGQLTALLNPAGGANFQFSLPCHAEHH